MAVSRSRAPEADPDPAAGELPDGLPAWLGTGVLAVLALSLALLPLFLEQTRVLRYFDLPVNGLLFLAAVWTTMRARRHAQWVLLGLLLVAVGFAASILGLCLDRTHPWR